jgi:hypothetical protein
MIKLFQTRETLVSYIPAEDGKIVSLFLQCIVRTSAISLPCVGGRGEGVRGRGGMTTMGKYFGFIVHLPVYYY